MASLKLLQVSDLEPGMISAVSVGSGSHILLKAGAELTPYIIDHLHNYNVHELLIDFGSSEYLDSVALSREAKRKFLINTQPDPPKLTMSEKTKQAVSGAVKDAMNTDDPEKSFSASGFIAENLLDEMKKNDAVSIDLNNLMILDAYSYKHCIDVSGIAMMIAKNMGLGEKDIHDIGTAGILLDIGKTKISGNILQKKGPLTEEEAAELKKHPIYGYDMIGSMPDIEESILDGIRHHHERLDGSGYPDQLVNGGISMYARILAVADIFDTLTEDKPSRDAYSLRTASEILMSKTSGLDLSVLRTFLSSVTLYPVGSYVKLSNGETAKVIRQNKGLNFRPLVVGLSSDKIYDLSSPGALTIQIET